MTLDSAESTTDGYRRRPSELPPAPAYGEQTDEILRELGYGDEAIDSLRGAGAIL